MEEQLVFGFVVRVIDQVSQSAPQIRKQLSLLSTSIERLRKRSASLKVEDGLSQFAQRASQTAAASRRLASASTSLSTSLSRLGSRSRSAGASIQFLHSSVSGLTAARVFGVLSRSIRGTVSALGDLIRIGADFDKEMEFASRIMKVTGRNAESLREEAKRLGATTSFTARQAARGFRTLAQAGYGFRDSMNLLSPALHLSGAGMVSMEKGTKMVTKALGFFSLGTAHAKRVADSLVAGFNAADTSLTELYRGLLVAGPVGAGANKSLEETIALLGLFASSGYVGHSGGVAIRNMFASLQMDTKNLREALQFLNLSAKDVNPKFNDMGTILTRLRPLMQRMDLIYKLFGRRTAPQVYAALNKGSAGLKDVADKMATSIKSGQLYAALMDTVAGRIDIFKSAIEGLKIEIFDIIKPQLKKDLADMTGLVNAVQRAVQRGGAVIRAVFGALSETFQFALFVLQRSFGGIGDSLLLLARKGKVSQQAINNVVGPMVLLVGLAKIEVMSFIEGFISGLKKGFGAASKLIFPFVRIVWRVGTSVGEMLGFLDKGSSSAERLGETIGKVIGVFSVFALAKMALLIPNLIIGSIAAYVAGIKRISAAIWSFLMPAQTAATATTVAQTAATTAQTAATTAQTTAQTAAAASTWKLNAAMGMSPAAWATIGIIALAGALYVVIRYWDVWTAWVRQSGMWLTILVGTMGTLALLAYGVTLPFSLLGGVLVGVAYLAFKYWNPIKAFFSTLFEPLPHGARVAFSYVKLIWDGIMKGISVAWDMTLGAVFGSFDSWRRAAGEIFDYIAEKINGFLDWLASLPVVGKAVQSAMAARKKDLDDARKKLAPKETSLTEKFLKRSQAQMPKFDLPSMPTFKRHKAPINMPKPPDTLNVATSPLKLFKRSEVTAPVSLASLRSGAALQKFAPPVHPDSKGLPLNPVQAQTQAAITSQSQQTQAPQGQSIVKNYHFGEKSVVINNAQIKDIDELARRLIPALQRAEKDAERRGA